MCCLNYIHNVILLIMQIYDDDDDENQIYNHTGCLLETGQKYGLIAWARKQPIS